MGQKIGAQAEAQNGYVFVVYQAAELVYLLGCEKLRLIGYYDVVLFQLCVFPGYILLGSYDLRRALQADAAFYGS